MAQTLLEKKMNLVWAFLIPALNSKALSFGLKTSSLAKKINKLKLIRVGIQNYLRTS
jgi:hypothetical protein